MLVLSRKCGESIVIDGRIVVRVVRVDGEVVKLGLEAPNDVPIFRQEIYQEIQQNNVEAQTSPQNGGARLPRVPRPGRVVRPAVAGSLSTSTIPKETTPA